MNANKDSANPIRVLFADDHPIVRQGMGIALSVQDDIRLEATAANGQEAVALANEIHPDVIIMDLQMPVMDGVTAIREIMLADPSSRIIVLTSFPDDDSVFEAIKAGAKGYLLKDMDPAELIGAIHAVFNDEVALHPMVARKLMKEIQEPQSRPGKGEMLTHREVEILQYLAQGLSNREIAETLTVSTRTVTTHVRNILDKLHLANRTQAALYAIEQGIVDISNKSKS
jgi:NarL family two-component system response regulator LiaR